VRVRDAQIQDPLVNEAERACSELGPEGRHCFFAQGSSNESREESWVTPLKIGFGSGTSRRSAVSDARRETGFQEQPGLHGSAAPSSGPSAHRLGRGVASETATACTRRLYLAGPTSLASASPTFLSSSPAWFHMIRWPLSASAPGPAARSKGALRGEVEAQPAETGETGGGTTRAAKAHGCIGIGGIGAAEPVLAPLEHQIIQHAGPGGRRCQGAVGVAAAVGFEAHERDSLPGRSAGSGAGDSRHLRTGSTT
jgi:hypothetical protein